MTDKPGLETYHVGELVVYYVGGPDRAIFGCTAVGEILEVPPWTRGSGDDSIEYTDRYNVKTNPGESPNIMQAVPEQWIVGREGEVSSDAC